MKRCYNSAFNNNVKKLQTREITSKKFNFYEKRFSNFHLKEEFDIYDHVDPSSSPVLNRRSKIISLFVTGDIIFVLAKSGVCVAFSRETKKRVCLFNVSPNEEIRSFYYNEENDSVITFSDYNSDELICRSTCIEYIRRGDPSAGFQLFQSESIKWPGIVEIDYVNRKIIIHSADHITLKVFDLRNYTFLFSIRDENIQEFYTGPGTLIIIYKSTRGVVPLKILSIEDGTVLKSFYNLLLKEKKVVFIAQVKEKLFIKQENHNLQIVDITKVRKTQFMTPCVYFFLYGQLFLTCTDRRDMLWNLRGELVNSFEDHFLWRDVRSTNHVSITSNADLIISYCKAKTSDGQDDCINISHIHTGECVGRVTKSNEHKHSKIRGTVEEALKDISFLFYDEDHNEIYTGNKLGQVHVWAN